VEVHPWRFKRSGGAIVSDASWRVVDLPHDWSIESKPDKDNPSGAGGGFFPGGVGWYRKSFHAPADWKGKRVSIEFDGVYRDAAVYLNGTSWDASLRLHCVLVRPHAEAEFCRGKRAGRTRGQFCQPNSRWYSGSGIYRHVRVVVTEPTHVAHLGVFVTTPAATSASAKVAIHTRVMNETSGAAAVTVETTLLDKTGNKAGSAQSKLNMRPARMERSRRKSTSQTPRYGRQSPHAVPRGFKNSQRRKRDRPVTTPVGIRTLAWSAEKGLLLNGKPIKLAGGSVHHDNGPLGAAAFDRAEERRVELMKAAGMNAVRTAHNPPSSAFLDACDRLGLLVLDEPFDVWKAHKVKFDYGTTSMSGGSRTFRR